MSPPGALDGVRVLDLSQVMAGPYCCLLLADLGADVVKVEKPGGDDARRMGPPFLAGESAAFLAVNRNKRSIVLDLKREAGAALLRRLAQRADVLVENFRPGTMERLGLGYEALRSVQPGLIYCSISGFGATGPYRERGGFDLIAQGTSGLMSVTGEPGRAPVKVGVPIAEVNAGLLAAYGILAAYVHRLRSGAGQYVDTSLLEAAVATTFWESAMFWATGETPAPLGSVHRLAAPYQAFRTADGYITVGAANQRTWEALCRALERDDLARDPRFKTNAARMEHLDALQPALEAVLLTASSAVWLARLSEAGVPCGPVNSMADVYADPQVRAREMVVELDHPRAGPVLNIGVPVKLSQTPGTLRSAAPLLGQHTDEVLRELGLADAEIRQLHAAGIVAAPDG